MLAPEGVVALQLEALDRDAALRQANARGLPVLSVKLRRTLVLRSDRFALVLFTQELLALLRAGLGLVEAIRALAQRNAGAGNSTLIGVLEQLSDGKPLSMALAHYPQSFPIVYVESVCAAEKTGALIEALSRFVHYQGQVEQIRQKLVSALIYPTLLLIVGGAVTLFLIGYVVPRFGGVYVELDRELPWASRLLFELGDVIDVYLVEGAMLCGALVAGLTWAIRSGSLQARVGNLLPRVPFVSERLMTYRLTRLYRTVAMPLHGGVPLVSALRMASGLLDTTSRQRLEAATAEVRDGGPLSGALERHGLTTPIADRMLQVGERSGDLAGLMTQAAAFHEEELGRWVERATRMLEPCLMLLIGALIGAIIVLMYMPIFDLAGTLQ